MSQLADALLTKTQQKLLQLLYGRPDRSFYTREILRLTGMGVHTIKRELDKMEVAAILTRSNLGNQHFLANPACPLYEELVSIVKKTVGVVDVGDTKIHVPESGIVYAVWSRHLVPGNRYPAIEQVRR